MLFGGSMQRTKKNHGFTLIELMVTIAVMSIIAMMAAPAMRDLVAKQRLNTTTRELVSTFNVARSQAALLRREVTLTLNSDNNNTETEIYWNPTANSTLTSTTTSVVFNTDGTVKDMASNTNFIICNSEAKKSKTIILAKTGTVSMGMEGIC